MSDAPQPKKQKTGASPVWTYFQKCTDPKFAKCLLCKDQPQFQHSGNTSNLFKHLKLKHPAEHAIAVANKTIAGNSSTKTGQASIQSMLTHPTYARDSKESKRIDQQLLRMIAKDCQPANIVNDDGFRGFVHALNPRYSLPDRRTIMR